MSATVVAAVNEFLDTHLGADVEAAFCYGSVAAGTATSSSDIGCMVITRRPLPAEVRQQVGSAFAALEKSLGFGPGRKYPIEFFSVDECLVALHGQLVTDALRTAAATGTLGPSIADADDVAVLRALLNRRIDIVTAPVLSDLTLTAHDLFRSIATAAGRSPATLAQILSVKHLAPQPDSGYGEPRWDLAVPMDNHVHSQWSWDNPGGSMLASCEYAVAKGIPAVAFTEHADFTVLALPSQAGDSPVIRRETGAYLQCRELDVEGYWESLERCRSQFPELTILSGIEAGEPHLFGTAIAAVLDSRPFERVLGSVHSQEHDGQLVYVPSLFKTQNPHDVMRRYFAEVLQLVETSGVFQVLAHLDYPMRSWPSTVGPFRASDFEEEYRTILRALARTDRVLEVNTCGPWPADNVVRWWYEEGGSAISFGSDAHEPWLVGMDFATTAAMVEACGFRPGRTALDFWSR